MSARFIQIHQFKLWLGSNLISIWPGSQVAKLCVAALLGHELTGLKDILRSKVVGTWAHNQNFCFHLALSARYCVDRRGAETEVLRRMFPKLLTKAILHTCNILSPMLFN